jgi:hypothetical protein
MRLGNWLQTFKGHAFYPLDPRPEDVDIEDVAHALSLICRFGGHCTEHYSVAQHSVLVAQSILRTGALPSVALWGLMHDAAEAYLGDIIWPVKQIPEMSAIYDKLERNVMMAICERFGMVPIQPDVVKHFDLVLLATEKRDVVNRPLTSETNTRVDRERVAAREKLGSWHVDTLVPLAEKIEPWIAPEAEKLFLLHFRELMKGSEHEEGKERG